MTSDTPHASAAGDGGSGLSPREELAKAGAEAYAELTAHADDPAIPEHARTAARLIGEALATTAAWGASADMRIADQEQLMFGEDMTPLGAMLTRRLNPGQIADLIAILARAL